MSSPSDLSPVKRALLEIRELRDRLELSEAKYSEPIAIVGLGCRLPGGVLTPDELWCRLCEGYDAIEEIPATRWDIASFYDPDPDKPGKMSTRFGGFLRDVDLFDAEFFNISAREAATIDPQQRVLLEVAWETLENASIEPSSLLGSRTGVFVGIAASDYSQLQLQRNDPAAIDAYFATGSSHSVAAGRIAYLLGLQGPCVAVDTACSASLVAVHLACQSLRFGDADLALAGGVSSLLSPEMFIDFSKAHMLAADGRCKTFDAAADGYVRSEGCSMVALKRLRDAQRDGDPVLAVIRGSAINHDGRSSGLTAPNGPAQVAVIRRALANAGVTPDLVSYVEAHGTGTSLGDPIEVHALAEALERRAGGRPVVVGSLKTNFGHLEAAAGVTGLLKVVLGLCNRKIPASLHFRTPNPHIDWHRVAVDVTTELIDWEPVGQRRLAGVSSFGFSGTNAHVVVEEAPAIEAATNVQTRPLHVLKVSASRPEALRDLASAYAAALDAADDDVEDFVCSANTGRADLTHRIAVVGTSAADLRLALAGHAGGRSTEHVATDRPVHGGEPAIGFLFTGQGAHYAGMGRELYEQEPAFRAVLDAADEALTPVLGTPLSAALYSDEAPRLLRDARFAQPALVAFECALAALWQSWGIRPAAVLGHSLGEYAGAVVASVLTLEDSLRLVAERGRLVEECCAEGRMMAVHSAPAEVAKWLPACGATLTVAAENGCDSTVVAGSPDDVARLAAQLTKRSVRHQVLEVTRAFHSTLIEPALDGLARAAHEVAHGPPSVRMLSTLTGGFFPDGAGPDADYWAAQARQPVRFDGAMRAASAELDLFVEIGPASTLIGMARAGLTGPATSETRFAPSLGRDRGAWQQMLSSLAQLYVQGARVDWRAFERARPRRMSRCPTYPFQRRRHWYDGAASSTAAVASPAAGAAAEGSSWQRLLEVAERQAARVPIELDIASYARRWQLLDDLTTGYIERTLCELKAFARPGEPRTPAEIAADCGVLPMYESLLERWLRRLAAGGRVREADGRFLASGELQDAGDAALAAAQREFREAPYVVEYLRHCGDILTAVVTGAESPLETLFPGGSHRMAVELYRHWPVSRYFNDIAAAVVAAVAAELPAAERLQALEIGAGTGGTTAAVLPLLPRTRTDYWFTDVSEFFFDAAQRDFAAHPFVHYGMLDIERPPEQQGYGRHAFHAVIAANVLHATQDLQRTVDHVLSLLRPGGVLVLYEVTTPQSWIDTSVALIAGWAKSADGMRDDGPLLSGDTWSTLLRERGFADVALYPHASPADVLGMNVIVARAPAGAVHTEAVTSCGVAAEAAGGERTDDGAAWRARLAEAVDDERREMLVDLVRGHVEAVLRRAADEKIPRLRNLMEIGMDSLMAVELRDRLTSALALPKRLPASLMFDCPNVEAIAVHLDGVLGFAAPEAERPPAAPSLSADDERAASIADLSDAEIEALLIAKLEGGKAR